VVLVVTIYTPMYHVSASFVLSAPNRSVISSPFESVIRKIGVDKSGEPLRPGDHVQKGDLLFALDTTQVEDQKFSALSDYDESHREAIRYTADKKPAEANIAAAKAAAAKYRVDLYQYQIDHSTVVAPYDAVVLKGDLSTRRGQKAQLGDNLFELTPDDQLRVELTVPERDIQNVKLNATGHLATNALPWDKFAFTVDRIIPVPEAKEGSNTFMVYARIDPAEVASRQPLWRPGMEGEARIDVGKRRLAWIWTHRLIDFLRLKLWM
jgi:multidrug efflux pump subunit AcrA (membrane-fusion protein)